MKMNFRPGNRAGNGWHALPLLSRFLLSLFGMALLFWGATAASGVIVALTGPLVRLGSVVPGIGRTTAWFTDKQKLLDENAELKKELESAQVRLSVEQVILRENQELKSALGRSDLDVEIVLANVLSGPGTSAYDTFLVDVGSNLGIRVGDTVISGTGALLGVVANVYGTQAKIELFSTYGRELHGVVGKSETPIDIAGAGGGSYRASVPLSADVQVGDLVTVPAFGSRVSAVVGSVEKSKDVSLNAILAQMPVNVFTLERVYIEKKKI
ncbi:MAG: rod shape-determining protein MreC [Patescibacteria group bacterium]